MTTRFFNNEQKILGREARKFCQTELEPIAAEIDRTGVIPEPMIEKLTELGFLGATVKEEYGGVALDAVSHCIVLEEVARSCASLATILAVNNSVVVPIIEEYASDTARKKYLGSLARGGRSTYAMLNEFDGQKTVSFDRANGSFRVSGEKEFALGSDSPEFFLIPVAEKDMCGFFIVEPQAGIVLTRYHTLGLKAAAIGRVTLDHVTIPADSFSSCGNDPSWYEKSSRHANVAFAAIAVGIAEAALGAATKYAQERKQFQRLLCKFPMVQDMLALMKIKNTAARLLVYDAAQGDAGAEGCTTAAVARVFATEAAFYAGTTTVQIHGGYGYTRDYPAERFLRDAKSLQVLGATPRSLKRYIAKELLT